MLHIFLCTTIDRSKSVRKPCKIEHIGGVFVLALSFFLIFSQCR